MPTNSLIGNNIPRPKPGFFNTLVANPLGTTDAGKKPVLVDVGGNGDCGFRAVAAGFIDNFISNERIKSDLLGRVLSRHFRHYPNQKPVAPGLVTPAERMQQLIKQVPMPELVQTLGFTFRQLAVDELVKNPAQYRGAFADRTEQTAPAIMRKPATWIDESAIAALAQALNLPIYVSVVERGKELPMLLRYNETAAGPGISIQLQAGHYIPRLRNAGLFSGVKISSANAAKPAEPVAMNDRSLPEILALIAEDDQRMLENFDNTHRRLTAMVTAGELTKADLLAMYIKGMKTSDYLQGRVKYVGIEHGNQHFFEAILTAERGVNIVSLPQDHDRQIIQELVHGIARATSIGHMHADEVFALLDEKEDLSARPRRAAG